MLRPDDREFRPRLQDLLTDNHRQNHAEGWHLCQDLGRAAVPMLWDLYEKQGSEVKKRLVLMVAAVLAGGTAEDERLLQEAGHEQARLEERVLAALLMALGPRRAATAANPWPRLVGRQRNPPPVLQIAAYLAASRFPSAAAERQLQLPENDPGLVAAAAVAGVPVQLQAGAGAIDVGAWFSPSAPPRHADLVRRGVLLGRCFETAPDQQILQRAEVLFRADAESQDTRVCAGLLLGRAQRIPTMPRPGGHLLEALAASPGAAVAVRNWLGPVPNQLDEDSRRLLSAYVYSRSIADVLADQEQWLASPLARRPVVLTLALRILAERGTVPALPAGPTELPEWSWVVWAAGQRPRPARMDDPVLEQAMELALEDRLPRATARTVLEEALWRSEAHPGLTLWRSFRALVRDLLLTGSKPGVRFAPLGQRYFATGLQPDHPLFEVAIEFFDFTNQPRPPLPPECRLP